MKGIGTSQSVHKKPGRSTRIATFALSWKAINHIKRYARGFSLLRAYLYLFLMLCGALFSQKRFFDVVLSGKLCSEEKSESWQIQLVV